MINLLKIYEISLPRDFLWSNSGNRVNMGKTIWYVWWTWDAHLTTTLVLFLIYVAYWMLREFTTGSLQIARSAAIFAIVGFVDVPIVFMSIRWWRTQHPGPVIGQKMGLTPSMLYVMFISLAAVTLLFIL